GCREVENGAERGEAERQRDGGSGKAQVRHESRGKREKGGNDCQRRIDHFAVPEVRSSSELRVRHRSDAPTRRQLDGRDLEAHAGHETVRSSSKKRQQRETRHGFTTSNAWCVASRSSVRRRGTMRSVGV